jgi:hypothetical protein
MNWNAWWSVTNQKSSRKDANQAAHKYDSQSTNWLNWFWVVILFWWSLKLLFSFNFYFSFYSVLFVSTTHLGTIQHYFLSAEKHLELYSFLDTFIAFEKKVKVSDLYTAVSYIRCTSRTVYSVGNLQVRLTYIAYGTASKAGLHIYYSLAQQEHSRL